MLSIPGNNNNNFEYLVECSELIFLEGYCYTYIMR